MMTALAPETTWRQRLRLLVGVQAVLVFCWLVFFFLVLLSKPYDLDAIKWGLIISAAVSALLTLATAIAARVVSRREGAAPFTESFMTVVGIGVIAVPLGLAIFAGIGVVVLFEVLT